jgi:YidC/Oxa1 family membrane protein insertase
LRSLSTSSSSGARLTPSHHCRAPTRPAIHNSRRRLLAGGPGAFAHSSGATRSISLTSWFWASKTDGVAAADKLPSTSDAATEPKASIATQPVSVESSTSTTPAHPEPIPESFVPNSFSDFGFESILDVPERIGFLKGLGLDFGWGPTAMFQWTLEHVYVDSGMPWWAAIATVAIGFRLIAFIPTLRGQAAGARLAQIRSLPEFQEAEQKMKEAAAKPNATAEMMQHRERMRAVMKKHNVSMLGPFIPMLFIVPFSFGAFRSLRAMGALPVPSLETGGFGWVLDLTVADPTYMLPLASAAMTGYMFYYQQKSSPAPPSQANMQRVLLYVLPPLTFAGTFWLPAVVQWFLFCLTASSAAQQRAALSPAVRQFFYMPPLSTTTAKPTHGAVSASWQAPQTQEPSRGIEGMLKKAGDDFKSAKQSATEYALGNTDKKSEALRAQQHEERRVKEERAKALRRFHEENRRRLAEQQRRR